jgi:hypothetical protein
MADCSACGRFADLLYRAVCRECAPEEFDEALRAMRPPAPVLTFAPATPPDWSARELVEALLAEIVAGTIDPASLMVCWMQRTPDGGRVPKTWSAGTGYGDAIALAFLEMLRTVDDWRK